MVAWIVTSYFVNTPTLTHFPTLLTLQLTQCGFILLVGQLLTVIKAKYILLGAIFFFELGSLLCALANGMIMLIVSRAIQGIGASGMFVSIVAIISVVTKVEQRAGFMAGFGFVFVIASVIGPLLGGVFTEQLSWRWCFWINLPVGGVAAAAVVFLLPGRAPDRTGDRNLPTTWGETLRRMDWIGSALVLVFVTCLLLALQWGGNQYRWDSWRVIVLFLFGGLLAIAFFAWEYYYDEDALIPYKILSNRTILAAAGAIFMLMMAMLGGTYQLPLFYQAGRDHSPQKSGIDIIPFMLLVCMGIFVSGGIVTKWGRYYWFFIIGPPIAAVGFGLLYTVRRETSDAKIIGYQILAGFGIGLTFQNIILAAQAEYTPTPHLIPQATSVVSFFQLTGAALGVGIVNTVLSVRLAKHLNAYAPDAPYEVVRESTQMIYRIDPALRPGVVKAYIEGISDSYIPIFIALALSVVFGVFIRNHNMLKLGGSPGVHMA
jgi:MFS family permease